MSLVTLLRVRQLSCREPAPQSAQAAKQRYDRYARQPDALPNSQSETDTLDFNQPSPRLFNGLAVEERYGTVRAEVMPHCLRAYARVIGRQEAVTSAVRQELLGG
jgi:hypothetical protein